ncbi:hypothetical protein QYS48_31640 [Marivirga arenosa]|uniref:Lipoprotein n=1 Tax=Marivirga arenosa TaxID=3059076 RepID=A0AA51R9T6_9BACT|nr:hypothetical protein [Marivirga sp. ABR2-2]WMN06113.1 hypothetical protein QYS48_31640 [Marivirga sp. ABR2-2]
MKKIKVILFPILFITMYACVNDEPDAIIHEGNLDKFLNSPFYSSLKYTGYEINEEKIEFHEMDAKMAIKVPINEFPSTMRIKGAYSEFLLVSNNILNENPTSMFLTYENIPKENYSGNVTIYDYSPSISGEPVTLEFENGKLKSKVGLNERSLNYLGCSTRGALACAGYRIEDYNWVETAGFAVGFPGSLLWEIASCIEDGCPY